MKRLIYLAALAGAMLHAQPLTISDTITTPMGGNWSGTVVVTLNNPQTAQPLYAGSVTLSGWSQTVTVTAGSFSISLYPNDTITPSGTSYTARYTPTSGSAWSEVWVVPTGATTIREIRSTTVPTPSVRFNPAQLNQAGATLGQALRWNGSTWAPGTFVADPMTTTGDLITRSGGVPVRVGIGSTGQVLTVAGGLPTWASGISGNAATATALAANGTNCSAGQFPLGVDASGNSEGCTALPTTIAGTTNQITASAATGSVVLSFPAGGVTLPGTTTGTFSGNLTGNVTGNVSGSSGSTTGNAATATALQTARTIAGVSFNGSANIAIASTGLSDTADIVRGAASIAAGQIPYGVGAGSVGSEAAFTYSAANDRATIGRALIGTWTGVDGSLFVLQNSALAVASGNYALTQGVSGDTQVNSAAGLPLDLRVANGTGLRLTAGLNTLLGTTTDDGTNRLQVAGTAALTGTNGTNYSPLVLINSGGTVGQRGYRLAWDSGRLTFQSATDAGAFTNSQLAIFRSTGNVSLKINDSSDPVDFNYKLHVGGSGSSGTMAIVDKAATIGATLVSIGHDGAGGSATTTQLIVRAGAGQSSTNLQTWQNAAGTAVAAIGSTGRMFSSRFTTLIDSGWALQDDFDSTFPLLLALDRGLAWSSTTSFAGTKDVSFSRAAANTGRIGDGGSNANGNLQYREWQGTARAFASLGTPANGTFVYCDNCTVANPCASGGTGALAKRLNGAWVCN